ncbi:hypothetical protein MGN01_19760 [Methylobacterium gnaphalii]|uniref:Uncharacterized protein n=1 Tax=Methylobacterium gnaphalii TaxID=1010610 RepID=A0A512JJK2_9HYPH|nr:hypothetical protein MGN01_19760 [Methylobacterium gnaphalii]GLS48401.1 hypothetical protein GCM10007885_12450 [Methylobacterium gnaphalii]
MCGATFGWSKGSGGSGAAAIGGFDGCSTARSSGRIGGSGGGTDTVGWQVGSGAAVSAKAREATTSGASSRAADRPRRRCEGGRIGAVQ